MRLSFFMPTMLPMIAVANIWLFFYAPGIGLASQILGVFGLPSINFLGSTETSLVVDDGRRRLERGRAVHDLLPGRAAVGANEPEGRRAA